MKLELFSVLDKISRLYFRSYCGVEDELLTSRSDPTPPSDLSEYHFKRLSSSCRSPSMESPRRLLARDASFSLEEERRPKPMSKLNFRELSHSLDHFPVNSEDKQSMGPRVNFSTNEEAETEPMLEDFATEEDRKGGLKSFLHAIFPKTKRERLNSEKSSLNGLQRESHV